MPSQPTQPPILHAVRLTVRQIAPDDALDPEDLDVGIPRDEIWIVGIAPDGIADGQTSAEAAEEAVLDAFHKNTAIAELDDFEIVAMTVPLSAHDRIALRRDSNLDRGPVGPFAPDRFLVPGTGTEVGSA